MKTEDGTSWPGPQWIQNKEKRKGPVAPKFCVLPKKGTSVES